MPDPFGSDPLELDELGNEGGGAAEPAVSGAGLPAQPPEPGEPAYGTSEPGGGSPPSPVGEEDEDDFEEFSTAELMAGLSPEELAELGLGETPAAEEGMTLEDLEEWVEKDPAGAVEYLASMAAQPAIEQLHHDVQERLQPVMQKHNKDTATWTLDTLRAQFSPALVDSYKDQLAEFIQAHPQALLGQPPETQVALLGDKLRALEYERQAAYSRGDDVIAQIDAVGAPEGDAFGIGSLPGSAPAFVEEQAVPQPQAQPPADPRGTPPRDAQTGRFVTFAGRPGRYVENGDGTYSQVREVPGAVHVEGGSQGDLGGARSQVDPDPTRAALDELDGATRGDSFGRPAGYGR